MAKPILRQIVMHAATLSLCTCALLGTCPLPVMSQLLIRDSSPTQLVPRVSPDKISQFRLPSGDLLDVLKAWTNVIKFDRLPYPYCLHRNLKILSFTSPFVKTYSPTVLEIFDSTARQIEKSYRYDENQGWLFESPAMPLPFKLNIARGYKIRTKGTEVLAIGKKNRSYFRLLMLGKYSEIDEQQKSAILREIATKYARTHVTSGESPTLKTAKFNNIESVYFEAPPEKRGSCKIEQWTFFADSQLYCVQAYWILQDSRGSVSVKSMLDSLKFD